MKKLIILLLIIFPYILNAQLSWNLVHDEQNHNKSHITDYALFQDSILVVAGIVNDVSCRYNQLIAYNLQGKQLWKRDGIVWLITSNYIVNADSNHIYTAGFSYGDDFGGEEKVIVSKFDAEGNLISELNYPLPFADRNYFSLKNIDIDYEGNILVGSKDEVFKTKHQFTNIVRKELSLNNEIKQINALTSGSYLITTENKLYKADMEFALKDSIVFNDVVKTIINNDSIYVLFQDELLQLDTTLNIIDSVIKGSDFDFQNMEFYQNELWLQGNSVEQIHLLKITNNNISDTPVFDRLIDDKGFVISNNEYIFIGNSFSKQIALWSLDKDYESNPNNNLPDIGIVDFDIEISEFVFEDYYADSAEDSFLIGYRFYPQVILKNNGLDTVKSFALYSGLYGGFNCARNFYYQKFDTTILPNQDIRINIKRLYQQWRPDWPEGARICFECLAPNSKIETEIEDNTLCKTFTIVSTPKIKQPSFSIYPNPASDLINIKANSEGEKNVILTNVSGKIISTETIYSTNSRINLDGLASGFYIIIVVSGKNIQRQILVKK